MSVCLSVCVCVSVCLSVCLYPQNSAWQGAHEHDRSLKAGLEVDGGYVVRGGLPAVGEGHLCRGVEALSAGGTEEETWDGLMNIYLYISIYIFIHPCCYLATHDAEAPMEAWWASQYRPRMWSFFSRSDASETLAAFRPLIQAHTRTRTHTHTHTYAEKNGVANQTETE